MMTPLRTPSLLFSPETYAQVFHIEESSTKIQRLLRLKDDWLHPEDVAEVKLGEKRARNFQ
jgi:hypothetical protein